MPPTCPVCSSGTAETVTAPSCDASAPIPSPASSIGTVTISAPAPSSQRADQHDEAGEEREEAELDDTPRRRVREHLGDPGRREQERDRERKQADPGVDRAQTEGDRQVERDREEEPALHQVLEEESGEAALESWDPEQSRVDERRATAIDHPLLPHEEQPHDDAAAEQEPDDGGQAQPLGRVRLRLHDTPDAGAEDPEDDEGHPGGRQRGADEVEAGALPEGGASAILRLSNRMPRTTITSPANTSRHDRYVVKNPPMRGPAATAMAPAEATSP